MIKSHSVIEGNLRADKCLSDFGGPNQWDLYVKTVEGYWENVQWMNVYRIQELFKTKLPIYREVTKQQAKYEVVQ